MNHYHSASTGNATDVYQTTDTSNHRTAPPLNSTLLSTQCSLQSSTQQTSPTALLSPRASSHHGLSSSTPMSMSGASVITISSGPTSQKHSSTVSSASLPNLSLDSSYQHISTEKTASPDAPFHATLTRSYPTDSPTGTYHATQDNLTLFTDHRGQVHSSPEHVKYTESHGEIKDDKSTVNHHHLTSNNFSQQKSASSFATQASSTSTSTSCSQQTWNSGSAANTNSSNVVFDNTTVTSSVLVTSAGITATTMTSAPAVTAPAAPAPPKNPSVVIKVGMVGDAQIGKTSLMVKYVEGSWDEDYIQTLGVNFMEKTILIRNTEITFSIWDLGGQREFVNMLPLVCNDAVAILFMFDLTRKSTLNSIKEWYRQGRGFNKTAIPFLVGTKYDHFVNFPREEQEEISNQAKRFAKAMKASLIFSSTSHSINVQKIFKIVLSKAFDLRCTIPEIENTGEPLLLYQSV